MASLPYPRRPLDNSPTDGTDAHRWFGCVGFSHRIHRCSQIRRVWHPCHTHATLCQSSHGIHRIHRSFWRKIFSHGFHRYPPTIAQTGWTKILRVLCHPWENISARNICAYLCHLWEDISARGFCGFCEFCGRMQWLLGWRCVKTPLF